MNNSTNQVQEFTIDDAVKIANISANLGKEVRDMLTYPHSPSRVRELFEAMSDSKYKPVFNQVLQGLHESDFGKGSVNWDRTKGLIRDYMAKYGFDVPE